MPYSILLSIPLLLGAVLASPLDTTSHLHGVSAVASPLNTTSHSHDVRADPSPTKKTYHPYGVREGWIPPADIDCLQLVNNYIDIGWRIYIPLKNRGDDGRATIDTKTGQCGLGLLDNIFGACHSVVTWRCQPVDAQGQVIDFHDTKAVGAVMTFYTDEFCSTDDAAGAIRAATFGTQPKCKYYYWSSVD